MNIPFFDLKSQYRRIAPQIGEAIQGVLDDGQYVLGKALTDFEGEISVFTGAEFCVGVSSGTDALLLPLMAKEIGPGDAVFVATKTYTATAEVILLAGATPVFVDANPETYNIDTDDLQEKITAVLEDGELRPAAIIAVDLYGFPADYKRLNAIAEKEDMFLLADAAQSFGGSVDNRRVGTLAPVTATSFYPAKPLGCYGDGGAIFLSDKDLDVVLRSIRTHGKGKHKHDVVRVGMNARLDSIQAAILSVKLSILDDETKARERVSLYYDERIGDLVKTPPRETDAMSSWAHYTFTTDRRDELQEYMKDQNIPALVYYPNPVHLQNAYEEFGGGPGSLPVSERLCDEVLCLPIHAYLDEPMLERITNRVRSFFGR